MDKYTLQLELYKALVYGINTPAIDKARRATDDILAILGKSLPICLEGEVTKMRSLK